MTGGPISCSSHIYNAVKNAQMTACGRGKAGAFISRYSFNKKRKLNEDLFVNNNKKEEPTKFCHDLV